MRLYEWDRKDGTVEPGKHRFLYHLTDHHGYAHTINKNALESSGGVCTTFNAKMSGVPGKWHYDFKFVLSGRKLVETYGAHYYTAHFQYVSDAHEWHPYSESEVRLDTKIVENFDQYLLGTVLLFDLFSEKGIQWLLYGNHENAGGMFSKKTSAAPRAIDMIYKQIWEMRKPIWCQKIGRLPTAQEMQFIKDAYEISQKNGTFKDGLIELCRKYPVVSHWGKPLDAEQARRMFLAPKLVKMLNDYYEDRKVYNIDIDEVKKLIESIFNAIGIGNNAVAVLMHEIDMAGLFHVMTPPVVWSGIITKVMEGDVDDALHQIDFLGRRESRSREWHDHSHPDSLIRAGSHPGTMFGRMSDHR